MWFFFDTLYRSEVLQRTRSCGRKNDPTPLYPYSRDILTIANLNLLTFPQNFPNPYQKKKTKNSFFFSKVELVEGCRSATFEEKNKCFFDFLKCISGKDFQNFVEKSANWGLTGLICRENMGIEVSDHFSDRGKVFLGVILAYVALWWYLYLKPQKQYGQRK